MIKNFKDYLAETEFWSEHPVAGDRVELEIGPDELIETSVIESDGTIVILEADDVAMEMLRSRGMISEKIQRYGAVGSAPGTGYTVAEGDIDPNKHPQTRDYGRGADDEDDTEKEETVDEDFMGRMLELAGCKKMEEDQPVTTYNNAAHTDPLAAKAADLAPVGAEQNPTTATTVDEGAMKDVATELAEIADNEDYDRLYDLLTSTSPAGETVRDMYDDVARDFRLHPDDDSDMILDRLMDRIADDFGDQLNESYDQRKADAYNRAIRAGQSPEQAEKIAGIRDADMHFYEIDTDGQMKQLRVRAATAPEQMQEAEYRGRKVPLGKPMRGDVKKFKVYVKDPKTGNVKKVNFGHGGKSAKRAGEKTLSIKKSNPARRRSFRARHNCDNPGPRTKARYWSCRAW